MAKIKGNQAAHTASDPNGLYIAELKQYLLNSDIVLVAHAAEALTEIGLQADVCHTLSARFSCESDTRSRCLLARELFRAGEAKALATLIENLHQPSDSLRIVAAECLFKLRPEIDEDMFRDILTTTPNGHLQLMVSAIFASRGDHTSSERIRAFLCGESNHLRTIAAWILARLGDNSDIKRLHQLRSSETDIFTLAYLDHTLAVLGDRTGLESLRQNLSSSNTSVRQMAAEMSRFASLLETEHIRNSVNDSDPDVRIRVFHTLLWRECSTKRAESL